MLPQRSKRTKQPRVPEKETQEHAVKRKKPVQSFKIYLYTVLNQVHPTVRISTRAMDIMNTFMVDIFERIATEAARLLIHSKKPTLALKDMEYAVKLSLSGELAKHAMSEGNKAIKNYNQSKLNKN